MTASNWPLPRWDGLAEAFPDLHHRLASVYDNVNDQLATGDEPDDLLHEVRSGMYELGTNLDDLANRFLDQPYVFADRRHPDPCKFVGHQHPDHGHQ